MVKCSSKLNFWLRFSQSRTQALPSSEGEAPGYEVAFQYFNCVKIQ